MECGQEHRHQGVRLSPAYGETIAGILRQPDIRRDHAGKMDMKQANIRKVSGTRQHRPFQQGEPWQGGNIRRLQWNHIRAAWNAAFARKGNLRTATFHSELPILKGPVLSDVQMTPDAEQVKIQEWRSLLLLSVQGEVQHEA